MSELERKVEALMRCMPREQLVRAMEQVTHRPGQEKGSQRQLNRMIQRTLGELGTPAHIKGYRYLVYALELAVRDAVILESITKGLYPAIAQKFQTTAVRVERAMRHAIELTWDRGDMDVLYSYFGNTVSAARGKPTNSEFVAQVSNRIVLETEREF